MLQSNFRQFIEIYLDRFSVRKNLGGMYKMLTPAELQNKIYNTSYDYRDNAMNEFMRDIQENYEQLYAKCVDFNSRIEQLNSSLQYYKSIENTLQNALFLAEKVSEEKLEEASQKAEKIENDALAKADDIVAGARNQLEDIKTKISDLQVEYEKYMVQYKNLVKGQLDLLEKEPFSLADAVNQQSFDSSVVDDEKKKILNNSDTLNINFDNNPKRDATTGFSADNIIIEDTKSSIDDINESPTEFAKFVEDATNSVDQMSSSIDMVNEELNEAGHELEHIAQDLENTAEILIGEEFLKNHDTEPNQVNTDDIFSASFDNLKNLNSFVDNQGMSQDVSQSNGQDLNQNVQEYANDNNQQYNVADSGSNQEYMNNEYMNTTDNTDDNVYTNFSNADYSQGFNSTYQQQYNPQYNPNFKQYNYEQQQSEPDEKSNGIGGFFKKIKK